MQGNIQGFALFHRGTWYKDADKKDKTNPQTSLSLMVMEPDETRGAVLRKIKIDEKFAGVASTLNGKVVTITVDMQDTNYDGKPGVVYHFVKGSIN